MLVTLLVVTLLTIIVVEFTHSTEVNAHITRNSVNSLQAAYLARSGVALAELTLRLDIEEKSRKPPERLPVETLADPWAQPFPPMPVGDRFGTAGYTIIDESSRFNLNALTLRNPPPETVMRQQLFQGILEVLELDTNLLYPLLDWLDPGDDSDRESGAESPYYLGLSPPYVPRNDKMLSLDELALVKGFEQLTYEQWQALRSLVTVLPNDQLSINVHTAPELLLKGLFVAVDAEDVARSLVSQRQERPFANAAELLQHLRSYQLPPLVFTKFNVRSRFFTIVATGSAGDVERSLGVTVERDPNRFPASLTILDWRVDPPPVTLTSTEASDGMMSPASSL